MIYNPKKKESFDKFGIKKMTIESQLKLSSESEQQMLLFKMINRYSKLYPILNRIYATPNGGKRSIKTAVTIKAEGAKKGVWDIFVPIPKNGKCGLFIEMKWSSELSKEQKEFKELLKDDYDFAKCYFGEEAMSLILTYIGEQR